MLTAPGVSFALVTEVMGWKLRPVPALEETNRLGRTQCLPAVAPWTLLLPSVGTLPTFSATHRSAGVGSVAALSLLFCPSTPWILHSTHSRTSGQREPLLGVWGLAGWWIKPNKGKTPGPPSSSAGTCIRPPLTVGLPVWPRPLPPVLGFQTPCS